MNFNSILKYLSYLTITPSVLMHDGIAHFRCEYDSYNIHEHFYHIIKSFTNPTPSSSALHERKASYEEKSAAVMENIKDDADAFCLHATQICDNIIKQLPNATVQAGNIIFSRYTHNTNDKIITLDESTINLPDPFIDAVNNFRIRDLETYFMGTTVLECKILNNSSEVFHILIATLNENRYPLFIFEYLAETSTHKQYKLYAEILPADNGKSKDNSRNNSEDGSGNSEDGSDNYEIIL